MADQDWDNVTRIGSKVRPSGSGGVDRERVVKGKSAINAANRSGAVIGTEKKFAGSNTKSAVDGQLLSKVDRTDEIIKPKTIGAEVGQAIIRRRGEMNPKISQKDLATKCNTTVSVVQDFERGSAAPDQKILSSMERVLGIKLRGNAIGELRFPAKK